MDRMIKYSHRERDVGSTDKLFSAPNSKNLTYNKQRGVTYNRNINEKF